MSNLTIVKPNLLTIKTTFEGTEFILIYNDNTGKVERILSNNLDNIYEKTENKSTDFNTVNNTKFPTVKAVDDFVKSFGLGVTDFTPSITDLNDTSLASGFYKFSNTATGNPAGSSGSLINLKSGANGYITQFAHFINAGDTKRIFIRHYSPALANWSTWAEDIHSQNINNFVSANNVLDTSTTDLITTSTGVDDEVYSFTVPANTFSVGDIIKMRLSGEDTSGNTTNKTMAFKLAGQSVNVSNFISTLYNNNQRFTIDAEIIVTGLTTFRYSTNMQVQRNVAGMNLYGNIFEDDKSTGTFDITTTNHITLDLNNVVNGDLVIKTISVKHFKA